MCKEKRDSGQVMVEWAVVLPLILLLTFGILQFALIMNAKVLVNHAAFAAARAELVGEDPERAAEILCSPVAGTAGGGEARIDLPGWGELPRSRQALRKVFTDVRVPEGASASRVRADVTCDMELWFPVVDLIFHSVSPAEHDEVRHFRFTETCTLSKPWSTSVEEGLVRWGETLGMEQLQWNPEGGP